MQDMRDSKRIKIDEPCIITVKGVSQSAMIVDISKSGIAFTVDNCSPFREALTDYSSVSFEGKDGTSGKCKVVRIDTFNSLGKALIGCRLVNEKVLEN